MPRLLPGTSPETDLYALTDDEPVSRASGG